MKNAKNIWKTIVLRWHSIVLTIGSMYYGFTLIVKPELFRNLDAYNVLDKAFSPELIGGLFLVVGAIKAYALICNYPLIRILALGVLGGLWFIVFLGLFIQNKTGDANAGYIFTGIIVMNLIGVALKEVFT